MDGWVTWLGAGIDGIANTYAQNVVATLATLLAPIALIALTIWWILVGWAVLRGEIQESVHTVFWKMVKATLIVMFALNAGLYNSEIGAAADGLRDGMATVFYQAVGAQGGPTTTGNVWTQINNFDLAGGALVHQVATDASWYNVPVWISLLLVMTGQFLLEVAALFIAIITKVYQSFFLAVGPVFILLLLFRPTARFFDGWLGMMVNTIVLCWIGLFLMGFGLYLAQQFATTVQSGWTTVEPVKAALQYVAMCAIFALMLMQAPSWAAALAGGSAMRGGMTMLTNILVSGAIASAGSRGAAGGGRNAIAPGRAHGFGYALGRAVRGASTVSTGDASAAARGAQWARQAAYKVAALRGRR
jgi:type IV secretion system protein VirB6